MHGVIMMPGFVPKFHNALWSVTTQITIKIRLWPDIFLTFSFCIHLIIFTIKESTQSTLAMTFTVHLNDVKYTGRKWNKIDQEHIKLLISSR